jgi:LuxR family maltose regulon positive regulatory protein
MTNHLTLPAGPTEVPSRETDPLLASKFAVPSAPPFTVERGRLLGQLALAVQNPMTVVTGPPGSGKTQLAASFVTSGRVPGPAIWITLEDGDDDPAVFWPYLVEGLQRGGVALSQPIKDAVHRGTFDRSMLARLAADLAGRQDPVILVLDSVSVLTDRQLAEDLDALLRHSDRHLRMVLVGRWDPPLPLYRYRLSGTLSEVRGDDLAFTTAETATLLAGHQIELPDWAISSLVERTEGWAVGIRLFAIAMEGRTDAEALVATIAGDDANIAEYFLGEVLAAQPSETRDFLLRTSIVDDFSPDLAAALIDRGEARHIIAALTRVNSFVQPVGKRSSVYRYHRLFAELLRAQLRYEQPELVTLLHRRAAAWFVAHGRAVDAIRQAVWAGDWGHACALLINDLGIARLAAGGDVERLGRSFQEMPANVGGPEPALVMAAQLLAAAEPAEATKHLDRAARLVADTRSAGTVPLRLAAALLEAFSATMQDDVPGALRAADSAEALIADAPPECVAAHPELRTLMLFCRGASQNRVGALRDAIATLSDAVQGPLPPGGEGLRLACLEQLALANAYHGRLQEAADVAGQAAYLATQRRRTSPQQPRAVSVILAWVATERWTVAAAWRHLRAAEEASPAGYDPLVTVGVALVRSRLLSGRGELRNADRVLSEARISAGRELPNWLDHEITFSDARLALVMGRPGDALATAGDLAECAPAQAAIVSAAAMLARGAAQQASDLAAPVLESRDLPAPLAIEAWLILAMAAGEHGDMGAARESLGEALALAAADGHRRTFHQAGPRLRRLLRSDPELAASYQALGASPHAKPRAIAGGAPPSADVPIVVDSLSDRELEVLKHLAAMLGTEEIADTMYLSVNTVKTHVRSVLRKLAASRRNEAVRRARALGIV